jgi:D-amino-acid oxidase
MFVYLASLLCLFYVSLFGIEHVYLKTPDLSEENIIGTHVGIRPYRTTGVRLEAEWMREKLIIHNYGYGGSGLTLAFGGSYEMLQVLRDQNPSGTSVAVLGAGAVGLAAAYDLLEMGYEVHLYAENWSPHLTSNVAAGSWTPHSLHLDILEEKREMLQRMLQVSRERLLKSTNDSPEFAGVKIMSYYILESSTPPPLGGEEVMIHFDNGLIKNAQKLQRVGLDGKVFMEDLFAKVKSKGAILHEHRFENREEVLSLSESLIINCLSLGARTLFDDEEFTPTRGQIVYFKPQAGIDYMLYQNLSDHQYFFHIFPWEDRMILGGVYEYGQENATNTADVIHQIIENAKKCLSSPRKIET